MPKTADDRIPQTGCVRYVKLGMKGFFFLSFLHLDEPAKHAGEATCHRMYDATVSYRM